MKWVRWFVEQLASCFIGETFNNWKSQHDNSKRLKLAEKALDSLLEAEKKNTSYYDDLDRILTNSSLIKDFALKVEPFDSDRLAKRIEQRINADTNIPYAKAKGFDRTKQLCHYILNGIKSNQKKNEDVAISLYEAKRVVEAAV